jgi:hypothetical protein
MLGALVATIAPATANPPAQRDPVELLSGHSQRYVSKDAGTEDKLSLLFGPYTIPPGQDSNRITVDLPPIQGFITAVAPELVDASDGRIPTEQEAHIHHAHWFRVDTTGAHEPYTSAGPASLSWVFGTGEEKTQGLFEHRWNMDPEGPMYGMPVEAANPQALIYMIHNKTASPLNAYVVLDVRFVHGTREAIEAARDRELHPIEGTLWGQTRDAVAGYPELSAGYTSTSDGTIVAMGSHLHPGGKYAVVANLGPQGSCTADADNDGFPGVTILQSRKFDRIPGAEVFSEDYQMGATKFGWRAPIHQGDVLRQYAPYAIDGDGDLPAKYASPDGLDHAYYEAMTYTGMYVDRDAPQALVDAENVCNPANYQATLLGEDTFETQSLPGIVENTRGMLDLAPEEIEAIRVRYNGGITQGMINHAWVGAPDPLCGLDATAHSGWFEWDPSFARDCAFGGPEWSRAEGIETNVINIAGFAYVPGDLALPAELGAPPKVSKAAGTLTLVNEDAAMNVRHTFTSCPAPCNGAYVSNYPLPDGGFDSDKMGNVDPIDGGLSGDWYPTYELELSAMDTGLYTYFCRIHPWMRGAFEIVA